MLVDKLKYSIQELINCSLIKEITNPLNINNNNCLKDRDSILIYTPPKTGSSTVQSFLQNANLERPIHKVHYLAPKNLAISAAKYTKENQKNPPIIRLSKILSQQIKLNPDLKWKIITLTREPFSRSISGLFQIIGRRHPELITCDGEVNIKKAVKLLETELTLFDSESNRICCWFDEELKNIFNLDVYQYPFSYQDGFTIINHNNIQVLIIRLEDLNRCFIKAISNFLDVEINSPLISHNSSKHKRFSEAYQQCQQQISLPKEVCENICNTKYVTHFYSRNERDRLIKKYSKT